MVKSNIKTSETEHMTFIDIRAGRYNQSRFTYLSEHLFNNNHLRYTFAILIVREWRKLSPHVSQNLLRFYHLNRNNNGNVWPIVTPRHKWFRQDHTNSTTYLGLKDKLKDQRNALHSPYFEIPCHKKRIYTTDDNPAFLDVIYNCYIRSRTCSGRPT